jgi:hypothetical protein
MGDRRYRVLQRPAVFLWLALGTRSDTQLGLKTTCIITHFSPAEGLILFCQPAPEY